MSPTELIKIAKIVFIVLLMPAGFLAGCMDEKQRHEATKTLFRVVGEAHEQRTAERIKSQKDITTARNAAHEQEKFRIARDLDRAKRELRQARASSRIVPTVSNAASCGDGQPADRNVIAFNLGELDRRVEAALAAAEDRSEKRLQRILAQVSGFETCAIWALEEYAKHGASPRQ